MQFAAQRARTENSRAGERGARSGGGEREQKRSERRKRSGMFYCATKSASYGCNILRGADLTENDIMHEFIWFFAWGRPEQMASNGNFNFLNSVRVRRTAERKSGSVVGWRGEEAEEVREKEAERKVLLCKSFQH